MKKIIKKLLTMIWTSYALRNIKEHGKIYVNRKSTFSPKTVLGTNCHFNGMRITGNGNVIIGDNFHSGHGCMMITSNHNYDSGDKIPYDETTIDKDIIIHANVWLGENVMILGGVTIGEGAIIQAGSVVVKDIPACAIAGGSPANVFKYRDEHHYNTLKEQGRFM